MRDLNQAIRNVDADIDRMLARLCITRAAIGVEARDIEIAKLGILLSVKRDFMVRRIVEREVA